MQKILIAAGGTGGHIYPALAVAEDLQQHGVTVRWLGAKTGLEQKIVKDKFQLYSLSIKALRGGGMLKKIFSLLRLSKSILSAIAILRDYKPDALLAMGGYVSAPGVIAAWILRVPVIIHEQNARAGMTNKYLSKLATNVLAGFPGAFKADKAEVVGNPVRSDFVALPAKEFSDSSVLNILVVGGSQGAKFFNDKLPDMFKRLSEQRAIEVMQQTGVQQADAVAQAYSGCANMRVSAFISDMPQAFQAADIIIARAGASTVAEVAAAGLPAIFVPFPAAVDDHQYYNAKSLSDNAAAEVIRQGAACVDQLYAFLLEVNSAKLTAMSRRAKQLAKADATSRMLQVCMHIKDKK